jgi:hypothetical protein
MSKDLEWGFLGKPPPVKKKCANALVSPRTERPKSWRYAPGDDELKQKLNVAKKNIEKDRDLRMSSPTIKNKTIDETSQVKATQSSPMKLRDTNTKNSPPPPLVLYKRKHSESKDYLIKYVSNEKKLESSKLKTSGKKTTPTPSTTLNFDYEFN